MDFEIVPEWAVNVTVSNTDLGQNPNLYYDVSTTRLQKTLNGSDHSTGFRYRLDDDVQCIGLPDGSRSRSLQLWLCT
jgi:hypothetical protein